MPGVLPPSWRGGGRPIEGALGDALGNTHYGKGSPSVDSFRHVGHYDQGGYLPPGLSMVYNGLRQPEAILTPQQWAAIRDGRKSEQGPTRVYNFDGAQGFTYEEFLQKEYSRELRERHRR